MCKTGRAVTKALNIRGPTIRRGRRWKRTLAALEGGRFGVAFASGCAATTTILHTLSAGDHFVAGDDLYGGTYRILNG